MEPAREDPAWHALGPDEVARRLHVDPRRGLDAAEVARRRAIHGWNTLPEPPPRSLAEVVLHQFASPLIWLLLVAAAATFVAGDRADALVILAVVVINAVLGTVQEGRAERSMDALRRLSRLGARALRGGAEVALEASELVPGDVVLLAAGDAVPADARVFESASLEAAEAALTGESVPVAKEPGVVPADAPPADRLGMVFAGTSVTAGRARALVVVTGGATEVGKIAALTQSGEAAPTPLEARIAHLGKQVLVLAFAMGASVTALGHQRGQSLGEILSVAVGQMVSMVPEGLPVAVTVALALGMHRMAARGAIVRRLGAVEALGATTIICTDKTGTLTTNAMTVTTAWLPDGRTLTATGVGWSPEGAWREGDRDAAADPGLRALLAAGALCNDASLVPPAAGSYGAWRPHGDPTEVALVVAARKAGLDVDALRREAPRGGELPFDPVTKLMATAHAASGCPAPRRVVVKGAPEAVLALCGRARDGGRDRPLDDVAWRRAHDAAAGLAHQALRLLAVAEAEEASLADGLSGLRGRLVLLGLVGQLDPPRPEVGPAVAECRAAGVRTVMVTGDHAGTGLAIARQIGLAGPHDVALDGRALEALDDAALARALPSVAVFARVQPAQKLRIVEAYQRAGHVVAMTGDGVNDAPALARADVGVAMGTGTEVAKGAAKVVLTDDDFTTIVRAVEEGRIVIGNVRKLVLYLASTALAELIVLFAALLLGHPPPLAAVQILWINLVTDGMVAVPLCMDPPDGDAMRRPPEPRDQPLFTAELLGRVALLAPVIALAALGYFLLRRGAGAPFEVARTETFTVLVVCQWVNALNCRSATRSALDLRHLLANQWLLLALLVGNLLHVASVFAPPLQRLLHTVPLAWEQVLAVGAAASLVLFAEELRKAVARERAARAVTRR